MPSHYTNAPAVPAIPAEFDFDSEAFVRAQALKYDIWFEKCSNASVTVTMHESWADDNLLALPDQPCYASSTCRLPPPRAGVRCALAALSSSAPDMTLSASLRVHGQKGTAIEIETPTSRSEVPETFAQSRVAWDIRDSDTDSSSSSDVDSVLGAYESLNHSGDYDSASTASTEGLSPGELEAALSLELDWDWEWESDSDGSDVGVLFDDTDCIHVLPSLPMGSGTGDEDWEHDFDEVLHSLPTPRAENAPRYMDIQLEEELELEGGDDIDEYDDVVEYMTIASWR